MSDVAYRYDSLFAIHWPMLNGQYCWSYGNKVTSKLQANFMYAMDEYATIPPLLYTVCLLKLWYLISVASKLTKSGVQNVPRGAKINNYNCISITEWSIITFVKYMHVFNYRSLLINQCHQVIKICYTLSRKKIGCHPAKYFDVWLQTCTFRYIIVIIDL